MAVKYRALVDDNADALPPGDLLDGLVDAPEQDFGLAVLELQEILFGRGLVLLEIELLLRELGGFQGDARVNFDEGRVERRRRGLCGSRRGRKLGRRGDGGGRRNFWRRRGESRRGRRKGDRGGRE